MAFSAITQPDKYMAAYSAVPLKLFDTDYSISDNYKYLVNLSFDKVLVTGATAVVFYDEILTKLNTSTPHNYILGDYIFLDDSPNSDTYTGYYIIKQINSNTEFIIDLVPGVPFGVNDFNTYKFIKYKFNPDLDGYAKVDMGNVLKDFVSEYISGETQDYNLTYEGLNTRFDYDIICGSESTYKLRFDDNFFSGGSLCFIFTGITSLTGIPFEVGDSIMVEQDTFGWQYYDNTYTGTYIGFSGFTNVPFRTGQTITITGQQTFPYYNGVTIVDGIPSPKVLRSQKLFQGNTPVEGGIIYGVPRPEYNGVCNILNIWIDPVLNYLVIKTDKPFTDASPVIPGEISFADGRLTTIPNELVISGLSVFNAHLNKDEYSLTEYDKYVVQNRSFDLNYASTILNTTNKYRVEQNTKGFLLFHFGDNTITTDIGVQFYNSNNQTLGQILITGNTDDRYFPIGLDQIYNLPISNNFGTPLSSYTGSVDSYCIFAAGLCNCDCLIGTIKFKPGSGTTYTINMVSNGELNGRPYWDWTMSATTGNVPVRLWWVNDGISFKWYITPQSNTTYNPFYLYDKDYNTDCPGDTLAWSSPIGSPLSGFSTGTLFAENPSGAITQYSNDVCFELNKDCSMYEIYHLMWKDKLGSFVSYPFIYVSRDNMESERKSYYKQEGTWKNNTFGYEDYGRGDKDFYLRSRKSIVVNSGWLYEFERHLMEDLIQSPSVYLQTPDNRLFGGSLEENKIEVFKKINEDIFSYSFNFIFANNEYRF